MLRFLIFLLLAVPGLAQAHAALLETTPGDGAVLDLVPPAITLRFNEPVTPLVLRLLDGSGGAVALPAAPVSENGVLAQTLPAVLPPGAYVVTWRIASEDTHVVSGAFTFGIGVAPDAILPVAAAGFDGWTIVTGLASGLALVGLGLAAGAGLFLALIGPFPGQVPLVLRASLLALAAFSSGTVATGASMSGAGLSALAGEAWALGFATSRGPSLLIMAAGLGLLCSGASRGHRIAAGAGALVALAALAFTGHVSTAVTRWLSVPLLVLHLGGMAFWLGSLLPLHRLLGAPGALAAVRRFSRLALLVVPLLLLSGVGIAAIQMQRFGALLDTDYGALLILKLVAVAALLLLAGWNRWRLTPALAQEAPGAVGRLQRSIAAEGRWALLLLAVTAVLMQTPPPRALHHHDHDHDHDHASAPAASSSVLATAGARSAIIDVAPGLLTVTLLAADHGPLTPKEVRLEFFRPDLGIAGIVRSPDPEGAGRYVLRGLDLRPGGRWSVTIGALVSDFERVEFDAEVDLP
jgi:copper transport protein